MLRDVIIVALAILLVGAIFHYARVPCFYDRQYAGGFAVDSLLSRRANQSDTGSFSVSAKTERDKRPQPACPGRQADAGTLARGTGER